MKNFLLCTLVLCFFSKTLFAQREVLKQYNLTEQQVKALHWQDCVSITASASCAKAICPMTRSRSSHGGSTGPAQHTSPVRMNRMR